MLSCTFQLRRIGRHLVRKCIAKLLREQDTCSYYAGRAPALVSASSCSGCFPLRFWVLALAVVVVGPSSPGKFFSVWIVDVAPLRHMGPGDWRTSIIGANLNRADLSRSKLNRADLNGAHLYEANLRGHFQLRGPQGSRPQPGRPQTSRSQPNGSQ